MNSFIGIIPARFASSRFPGKPLADLNGKPMVQRVYERAAECLPDVFVATDDERIFERVEKFGGKVLMTSTDHKSGTDRCAEAADKITSITGSLVDVVINIQGDEPFFRKEQIDALKKCFEDKNTQIATLVKKIDRKEVIFDPNRPKVVIDKKGFALYFSRSPIPYLRDYKPEEWLKEYPFYQHIGMYAYTLNVLQKITKLPEGHLEKAESLEQLRWLENGYHIKTAETAFESFGIDTPADLQHMLDKGIPNDS